MFSKLFILFVSQVELSKNSLKLWFKNKLADEEELARIDNSIKYWILMEMVIANLLIFFKKLLLTENLKVLFGFNFN